MDARSSCAHFEPRDGLEIAVYKHEIFLAVVFMSTVARSSYSR